MCSIFIGWRMLCILFVISLDVSRRICSMLYRRFDFKCKTNTKKRYSVIDTCGSTFGSFSLLIFIEIFYDWKYFKRLFIAVCYFSLSLYLFFLHFEIYIYTFSKRVSFNGSIRWAIHINNRAYTMSITVNTVLLAVSNRCLNWKGEKRNTKHQTRIHTLRWWYWWRQRTKH